MAHTIVGTPYYLSPELCEEKPYNHKSDIWSLGCVLYELCTFRHPFEAKNQGSLIMKIVKGQYPAVSSKYSEDLREMIGSLLTKDYRKRPAIVDILAKSSMKARMQALGYSADDHLLTQTMVNGGGLQFKRANSHEVKVENQLAKAGQNSSADKKDFPPGKFVDNKGPNYDQLRKELAQKNKAPVSGRPVVSAGNVQPIGISTPGKQKMRPASGRVPNRNQINQAKYKELLYNNVGQP